MAKVAKHGYTVQLEPTPLLLEALSGIFGTHIRVRHELPDASARLMETLGVLVEIDPDAPDCFRVHDRSGVAQRCRRCARVDRERREAS